MSQLISSERIQLLDQLTRDELLDALIHTLNGPYISSTSQAAPNTNVQEATLVDILARAMRKRHNHTCLIRRLLPNELLGEIFQRLHARSRITASQTCRHWRKVALSSPRLWIDIDFNQPQRAIHFLDRSKSAPISVTLPLYSNSNSTTTLLDSFAPHLHRTRILNLSVGILNNVLPLSFPPAPNLQILNIRGHAKLDIAPILPTTFSSESTPQLQDLTFRHAFPTWSSPIFTGLRRLTLDGTRAEAQPTVLEILLILEKNQNLEFFHLTTAEGLPLSEPYHDTTINLSKMSQFQLHCPSPASIHSLLGSIILPPTTELVIASTLPGSTQTLLTLLPPRRDKQTPITTLSIQPTERGKGLKIQGSNGGGRNLLSVRVECIVTDHILQSLEKIIHLDQIESLSIKSLALSPSWISSQEEQQQQFIRLQSLALQNIRRVDEFIENLGGNSSTGSLTSISLHSTDISHERLLSFVLSHSSTLHHLDHRRNFNGPIPLEIISQIKEIIPRANFY